MSWSRVIILLFGVLLAGSLVYWQERMLFLDAPHILFRIINEESLQITVNRYGSFVTQMQPLLATKLHLPLAWVMRVYSMSFNIFYLLVALLLCYRYKRVELAVLLGMYCTLLVSDTYYWTNNEVHQGIAWLLLGMGASIYVAERWKRDVLVILAFGTWVGLAIWTHPLVMFVAGYLWLFLWIGYSDLLSRRQWVGTSVLLILLAWGKYYESSANWYDANKIDMVRHVGWKEIKGITSSVNFRFLVSGMWQNYWLLGLGSVVGLAALLWQKKWLQALLGMAAAMVYVAIVCLTYREATPTFYIESEYMPLTIILMAPFVYYVLPRLKRSNGAALLAVAMGIRLAYISAASPMFVNRVELLRNANEAMNLKGLHKVIVPDTSVVLNEALVMNWGVPVESMLLSAVSGDKPNNSWTMLPEAAIVKAKYIGKDTLLGCFEQRPYEQLNKHYFEADTSKYYVVMSYDELVRRKETDNRE